MAGLDDPITLGLLGASAGFLDPHGGMSAGFQGGMNAMLAGRQMQQQDMLAKMQQQKMLEQMQMKQTLKDTIAKQQESGKVDPVSIGNALISTGHPGLVTQGLGILKDFRSKVKSVQKGYDEQGNAKLFNVFDTGETTSTGISPAEKALSINQGSQYSFLDPYTLQPRGQSLPIGMSQGEAYRLAQSEAQHRDNMGIQQQRLSLDKRNSVQPKFVDGAWVTPPTADNPQGGIIPTDMYVPPKGSVAAQHAASGKVGALLDEAEKYIPGATGSVVGNLADMGAGALGVGTEGAQNIARLKTLEAGLVMGMPRLEGPQSNLDQQLYREAAGQIGNPNVPRETKKSAVETIRRIQNTYPSAFGKPGSSRDQPNDGWGELR